MGSEMCIRDSPQTASDDMLDIDSNPTRPQASEPLNCCPAQERRMKDPTHRYISAVIAARTRRQSLEHDMSAQNESTPRHASRTRTLNAVSLINSTDVASFDFDEYELNS